MLSAVYNISSNIPKLYILPAAYLYIFRTSQNKQRISSYTAFSNWFLQIEMASVYCAYELGLQMERITFRP